MTLKIILCQRFGESIGNLILGIDREDLDESLSHMFTKMMVTHIDVLGPRASLGSLASSRVPELSSNTLQYT